MLSRFGISTNDKHTIFNVKNFSDQPSKTGKDRTGIPGKKNQKENELASQG